MLAYSSSASLDAGLIFACMLALSPNRGRVGLLAVEVAIMGEDGLVGGERLMEFRQTQGTMDA